MASESDTEEFYDAPEDVHLGDGYSVGSPGKVGFSSFKGIVIPLWILVRHHLSPNHVCSVCLVNLICMHSILFPNSPAFLRRGSGARHASSVWQVRRRQGLETAGGDHLRRFRSTRNLHLRLRRQPEANVRNKERSGGKPRGPRRGGGTPGRRHLVPAVINRVAVRSGGPGSHRGAAG